VRLVHLTDFYKMITDNELTDNAPAVLSSSSLT
jgi:hypothetical protein